MAQDFAAELGSSFLNNSNWESVYTAQDRPLGIPPPAIPPSSNLQSVLWNSTMENFNYTFLRYSADVADPVFQAPNALDYYFRPNIFSYTVLCTYPISGQYGFPNRLLFYLLMIFALVVRKHSWLAAAALVIERRYSYNKSLDDVFELDNNNLPKAIQASDYGDLDLEDEVRKHARAVAVCWGFLMFAALVPTLSRIWHGVFPVFDIDQYQTCSVDLNKSCTYEYINKSENSWVSSDYYDKRNQGLQAYLISERTLKLTASNAVYWANIVNAVFLCFIIGHGILGLLQIRFTQTELRNKLFAKLGGSVAYNERAGMASKARYYIAKTVASSSYILAWAAAIICPAVFISSVVINEINVWGYPVSEKSDAVGQASYLKTPCQALD
ncbi:MAG: hypothetical protein L6R39_001814 [Caloplaca ligustica]|nr:MAG: hypothetical protein L6R39_001814 [Caloplaca ligustica]